MLGALQTLEEIGIIRIMLKFKIIKMRMKIGLNQTTKTIIQIKIIIKDPIVRQIIEMKEVIRVKIM